MEKGKTESEAVTITLPPLNTLDLSPTQLTYLKRAVFEKRYRYNSEREIPKNLSMKYTPISNYEKQDLMNKLESLKPKPVKK